MSIETQWLNGSQTKKLLNVSESELRKLRISNAVTAVTLDGKIHYRLDSLFQHMELGSCVTYHKVETVTTEVVKEPAPEVIEEVTPVEEVVEASPAKVLPVTSLKFVNHASKEWGEAVKDTDLPCFTNKTPQGTYVLRKSLEFTLVDVSLYETVRSGALRMRAQFTLRSLQTPTTVLILQVYPLLFHPGKVFEVLLNNFVGGQAMRFENSGEVGKQRFTVSTISGDKVGVLNQWEEADVFQASLSEKELIVLAMQVKHELIQSKTLEPVFNPNSDKAFKKLIPLTGTLPIETLENADF